MTENTVPNPDNEQLKAILSRLSMTQIRFVIARIESKTDKAAADEIGIAVSTAANWENKAEVNDAVTLMRVDGLITALEIRRRNLAKAMAVKVDGLDSSNEKVRQDAATELIEWELGRAQQKTDVTSGGKELPATLTVVYQDKKNPDD